MILCIAEDPVYLCVLPDSDHELCSVDESNDAVDTTDTCTADSTNSKSKKKFLRKEDSGTKSCNYFYATLHASYFDTVCVQD